MSELASCATVKQGGEVTCAETAFFSRDIFTLNDLPVFHGTWLCGCGIF